MITHTARWHLAPPDPHPDTTTPVNLVWSACEPLAVRMDITDPATGRVIQWVLARDLLADGLAVPTGEGDVRVGPHPRTEGVLLVALLNWDTGTRTELATDADQVAAFLGRTYTVVGAGYEHADTDLDAALADLLSGGGRQ